MSNIHFSHDPFIQGHSQVLRCANCRAVLRIGEQIWSKAHIPCKSRGGSITITLVRKK